MKMKNGKKTILSAGVLIIICIAGCTAFPQLKPYEQKETEVTVGEVPARMYAYEKVIIEQFTFKDYEEFNKILVRLRKPNTVDYTNIYEKYNIQEHATEYSLMKGYVYTIPGIWNLEIEIVDRLGNIYSHPVQQRVVYMGKNGGITTNATLAAHTKLESWRSAGLNMVSNVAVNYSTNALSYGFPYDFKLTITNNTTSRVYSNVLNIINCSFDDTFDYTGAQSAHTDTNQYYVLIEPVFTTNELYTKLRALAAHGWTNQ